MNEFDEFEKINRKTVAISFSSGERLSRCDITVENCNGA